MRSTHAVRLGFRQIKGLSEQDARCIIEARFILNRHPEVLGATRRASKDARPQPRPPSFEARSLRSLAPQDDGAS
jgi:hypothetical protein